AVKFELALVDVTAPTAMLFAYDPAEAAVTVTVTVQLPDIGIVPPDSDTVPPPIVAVAVPPQVVEAVDEFVTPAGYVSVKAAPVIATELVLDSVIVRTEVPPATIGLVPKDLATSGRLRT